MKLSDVNQAVVNRGLDIMIARFGEHGEHPLAYHNEQHALDVAEAAYAIGKRIMLDEEICQLLYIAGIFHDTEHRLKSIENERESAELALETMRTFGNYSAQQEQFVHEAIMATVVTATSQGILQSTEKGKIHTEVLADADLSSLGKPSPLFMQANVRLFFEENPGKSLGSEDTQTFIKKVITFMSNRNYFTQAARELYPHLSENLQLVRQLNEQQKVLRVK